MSDRTDIEDTNAALVKKTLELAVQCHRLGRLEEAEELYRAVLRLQPDHPDANHNLGSIAVACGQFGGSLAFFQAALQARPGEMQYWVSLVDALIQAGERSLATDVLEEARRAGLAIEAVAELVLRLVQAWTEPPPAPAAATGREPPADQVRQITRHFEAGRFEDVARLGQAMARKYPHALFGWKSLGAAWMSLDRTQEAMEPMRRALDIRPTDVDMLSNLGLACTTMGQLVSGEVLLRRAVHHAPGFMQGWFNLGICLRAQARADAAEQAYRRALAVGGDDVGVLLNLGILLTERYRYAEAEECLRRALALDPQHAQVRVSLGMLHKDQGRLPEALQVLREAMALDPTHHGALSCYLFVANCVPEMDPHERFAAYRHFDEHFGLPHRAAWRPHGNDRNPQRRLRVGYVAPVFRRHACQQFLEPLLAHHDPERVELYAYSEQIEPDDIVTDRYRACMHHWIDTRSLSDDALAERIRSDDIDILVDIAGQTKGHRLGVFARKPAPVSLHWLDSGYTTGLSAIDYYLTDEATVPTGYEALFSETPWRLPRCSYAFRPHASMGPVNALPALERGHVTFGTLTRAVRLNERVVAAWARVLLRVPGSRLVVNSGNFSQPTVQAQWMARFAAHGVAADRIDMGFESPPWNVLRGIDIALDCFPQNSGTTLIESLYMGLPFVTLAGVPSMGTLGASILTAAGCPQWIAHTEEEYVDKLVALAQDLPALAQCRQALRGRLEQGPIMDEAGFARTVEDAYTQMFTRWAQAQEAAQPKP